MWSRRLLRAVAPPANAVQTHDAGAFPVASRRTRFLRLLLAGGALALLAAAAVSARELDTRRTGLLPGSGTGVVIVDLSLSIEDQNYRDLRRAFGRLMAEDASIGLVVFSDIPYELLPPGTPASELRPLLRLLTPPARGTPVNPWAEAFRAGTKISAALELAGRMLARDKVKDGAVLLISDLETAPDDVAVLTRTVAKLHQESVSIHILPLGLSSDARLIFGQYLDESAFGAAGSGNATERLLSQEASVRLPLALMILGGCCLVALALHERFGGRLALPAPDSARPA